MMAPRITGGWRVAAVVLLLSSTAASAQDATSIAAKDEEEAKRLIDLANKAAATPPSACDALICKGICLLGVCSGEAVGVAVGNTGSGASGASGPKPKPPEMVAAEQREKDAQALVDQLEAALARLEKDQSDLSQKLAQAYRDREAISDPARTAPLDSQIAKLRADAETLRTQFGPAENGLAQARQTLAAATQGLDRLRASAVAG